MTKRSRDGDLRTAGRQRRLTVAAPIAGEVPAGLAAAASSSTSSSHPSHTFPYTGKHPSDRAHFFFFFN